MKKALFILLVLVSGIAIGWGLKGINEPQSFSPKNKEKPSKESKPLIQKLIENSPKDIFFEEDYGYNRQSFEFIGQVGNYKVVKYTSEFGPGSKSNYKLIFYDTINTFRGYYSPFLGFGQIYIQDENSLSIDFQEIDLRKSLPDSILVGSDAWMVLR